MKTIEMAQSEFLFQNKFTIKKLRNKLKFQMKIIINGSFGTSREYPARNEIMMIS